MFNNKFLLNMSMFYFLSPKPFDVLTTMSNSSWNVKLIDLKCILDLFNWFLETHGLIRIIEMLKKTVQKKRFLYPKQINFNKIYAGNISRVHLKLIFAFLVAFLVPLLWGHP